VKNSLYELWPKFQEVSEDDETALCHFTQFIMAQLDGGDYSMPASSNSIG
jgi:hypothetical protein